MQGVLPCTGAARGSRGAAAPTRPPGPPGNGGRLNPHAVRPGKLPGTDRVPPHCETARTGAEFAAVEGVLARWHATHEPITDALDHTTPVVLVTTAPTRSRVHRPASKPWARAPCSNEARTIWTRESSSLCGRPVAARRRGAEAPPRSHTRRQRRTLSARTPTALAISAFETPASNNSTARTRRASADRGGDKGGREEPVTEYRRRAFVPRLPYSRPRSSGSCPYVAPQAAGNHWPGLVPCGMLQA